MKKNIFLIGFVSMLLIFEVTLKPQAPAIALEKKQSRHLHSTIPASRFPLYKEAAVMTSQARPVNAEHSRTPDPKKTEPVYYKGLFKNAQNPLITPTYEGSGQAVHPNVIDFKLEYNLDSWRGFRYWMVMTPYPNGYERHENPSLLVSQDGLNWVVPSGIKNPIDTRPGQANFNSDPALVYDPDAQALLIYWRETLKGQYDRIWRIKYTNAGKLEPKVLVHEEPWGIQKKVSLSPSIWRKSAKEWYMWTASGTGGIYLYTSTDGIKWSERQQTQSPWLLWNDGFIPWHLEVKPNSKEKKLHFLISGWPKSGKITDQFLVYAEASMDNPIVMSMPYDQPLLVNGPANQWDDDFLYKSSFVAEEKEGQTLLHIWYSARSTNGVWHIGYTEGALPE